MLKLETKEYDKFKFTDDNRSKIDRAHIEWIKESIKKKNQLESHPIYINKDMEIIDGQHRLIAAKELGVSVYYIVDELIKKSDMISFNLCKPWNTADFFNFYCKNGYEEYLKLKYFIKEFDICLNAAIYITMGRGRSDLIKYKEGDYKFTLDIDKESLNICVSTIRYIKMLQPRAAYLQTSKFWVSLIKVVTNVNFNEDMWNRNISKLSSNFCIKATKEQYLRLLIEVHNWHNKNRIKID